jgi:outer membrane lipoprotein-sorting protein
MTTPRTRSARGWLLAWLGLMVAPLAWGAASSDTAEQVLAALAQSGRALKTMRAQFEQTKTLTLLQEQESSRGKVLLQVPGRFRWDYLTPQPGAMVIKDGRFARYVPQTRQVFRGPAKGEADLLVGFGPGAGQLGKKYDVTFVGIESVAGRPAWMLDLKPRAGQGGLFAAIRLWVDKQRSIPVQTRLTEPTGDYTVVRFDKVEINTKLGGAAFDLALPKDVVEVQ